MVLKAIVICGLTAGPTLAQTSLFTESPCLPVDSAFNQFAIPYEEKPLFAGTGFTMVLTPYAKEGIPAAGPVFFTVNQTTGTWSMFWSPDPETLCLISSGNGFEPE